MTSNICMPVLLVQSHAKTGVDSVLACSFHIQFPTTLRFQVRAMKQMDTYLDTNKESSKDAYTKDGKKR
jgi:hypothetical protein